VGKFRAKTEQLVRWIRGGAQPADKGISRIKLDYPIFPRKRALHLSAGGRRISALFAEAAENSRVVVAQMEALLPDLKKIELSGQEDSPAPHWLTPWMPALDSMTIYALIRSLKPLTYLEIGSGMSTKFARRAISDGNLSTRIVSVDPKPRAGIDQICDEVVRQRFDATDLPRLAKRLQPGDVVFVDNSHQCFQSSDVTVFFTEFLPAIPPGVTWGLHDIFLPFDYPDDWRDRFYNEQYLLAAYLLAGHRDDEIVFPAANHSQIPALAAPVNRIFNLPAFKQLPRGGVGCWLRRKSSGEESFGA